MPSGLRGFASFAAVVAFAVVALAPESSTAQPPCNRVCDAAKRDANGCCPSVAPPPPHPPPPPNPAQPPPPSGKVGTKCANSSECPGELICINYRCQTPPVAPPPAPAPPPPPPQFPFYWVGIAWNAAGAWATRTGNTQAEAQASALAVCNHDSGSCFNAQNPVTGEKFQCFAIYRAGAALRERTAADLETAKTTALQDCQATATPAPVCDLQIAACNQRQ